MLTEQGYLEILLVTIYDRQQREATEYCELLYMVQWTIFRSYKTDARAIEN